MSKNITVTIIGCGYVGLTTAAILANCGMTVYALEVNPERLASIKSGRSFFYEEGIDRLIAAAIIQGTLIATDDYAEAIPDSSIVFSCVGTPDNADGSANLNYVFDAAKQALGFMAPGTVYVQKSTVPVGTGRQVEAVLAAPDKGISYVSNPEFLRESTAIRDTLWFDRVVVGSDDQTAARSVIKLYKSIETCRGSLAKIAGLTAPDRLPAAQYISTQLSSAELIKVSANAFLALKISFANSIAKLSDQAGADIVEVMDAVGADRRIGRAFLDAGRGYGGGCFPKDVSSLIRSAKDHGVDMEIMRAAARVNQSMPDYIIARAEAAMKSTFNGLRVAVLGVAFKAGTSDTRRSPGVAIANTLASRGAHVRVYDPAALHEAAAMLDARVTACSDVRMTIKETDAVFIATDWPEIQKLGISRMATRSGGALIVDCMNCMDIKDMPHDIAYIGVGREHSIRSYDTANRIASNLSSVSVLRWLTEGGARSYPEPNFID